MESEVGRTLRLYDAHNHAQDERLGPEQSRMWALLEKERIEGMVVNGSCEEDWPKVLELARQHPQVIPSFGYHPWYVKERSDEWQRNLQDYLDRLPSAVGEIGLDKWIQDYNLEAQEEVFGFQLRVAAERNLPASIHCLQAWGRLYELLRAGPRPACGFVLHSFGGPLAMVEPLAKLGAYFSLPGYFAQERKVRQRDTFRHVPRDRLLLETDAPDQPLPAGRVLYPLTDPASGKPLNHPANLRSVYDFAAELFNEPVASLAERIEENFSRIFGRFRRQ
jgi:TatD DNase family protein